MTTLTWVRYARWDLASVDLVDGRSGERLCTLYPLDKRANADGVRRPTSPGGNDGGANGASGEHELRRHCCKAHPRRPGRHRPAGGSGCPMTRAPRTGRPTTNTERRS